MLDLIEKLSQKLDSAENSKSLVSALRDFFIKNFKISRLDAFVLDKETNRLVDFSKDWVSPDCDLVKSKELQDILPKITRNKYITDYKNFIFFSLPKNGKSIGIIKIEGGRSLDKIIEFMHTASYIISIKIQNVMLAESMKKNLDFYELMKNIAKIIETQYELNYVIPLIGEMIDKFMSNCLIYIFIRHKSKMELMWPANCKDKTILEEAEKLTEKYNYNIFQNGKTGIFPLVNENRLLGCIAAKTMSGEFSQQEINHIEQLAKQASSTINRAIVYGEILKHATLDALTGFYNRRHLEERIKQETSKAKRQKTSLCVIMTDIDFFKRVNDTYGHAAGDLVLQTVSKTIRSQLREYDIAGRYGGEEFALLLPFTRMEEAVMVAERLRKAVENKKVDLSKINPEKTLDPINITISSGIYEFKPQDSAEDLLKKADKALYEAKESGRNKIVVNKDE